MTNQIPKVSIEKKATEFIFFIYIGNFLKNIELDELIEYIFDNNIDLIYFETVENEKILLSGYVPIISKELTKKHLIKSAKAKVAF